MTFSFDYAAYEIDTLISTNFSNDAGPGQRATLSFEGAVASGSNIAGFSSGFVQSSYSVLELDGLNQRAIDFITGGFDSSVPVISNNDGSEIGFNSSLLDFTIQVFNSLDPSFDMLIPLVQQVTFAALQTIGDFVIGAEGSSLDVAVVIASQGPSTVASAGPASFFSLTGQDAVPLPNGEVGIEFFTNTQLEIGGGFGDLNGNNADIFVTVNADFLATATAFLSTDPNRVPGQGQIDYVSVLVHELLHGLGFLSVRDNTGEPLIFDADNDGDLDFVETTYGTNVIFDEEAGVLTPSYIGSNVVDTYGAGVVLESTFDNPGSDISHFALFNPDGSIADTALALMNPSVIPGDVTTIAGLELAVLRDLGYNVVQPFDLPLVNQLDTFPQEQLPLITLDPQLQIIDGQPMISVQLDDPSPFVFLPTSVGLEFEVPWLPPQSQRVVFEPGETEVLVPLDQDLFDFLVQNPDFSLNATLFNPAQGNLPQLQADIHNVVESNPQSLTFDIIFDPLLGDDEQNSVVGTADSEAISGQDGNDFISGNGGDDILIGGDGNDFVTGGAGNDVLRGGEGFDQIDGGDGIDTNDFSDFTTRVVASVETQTARVNGVRETFANIENLTGGSSFDTLNGDAGNNVLRGLGSADRLIGQGGNDTLEGGDGNDTLLGGTGNDLLLGEDGDDVLSGAADNDFLNGGNGNDILSGGSGDDELIGAAGDDQIRGDVGVDTLYGDSGNDTLSGGNGNDTLFGGRGEDTLFGGNDSDLLIGNGGNDRLFGNAGNDVLNGDAGDDLLNGGDGDDVLFGGEGNDTLNGGISGNDRLFGGDGNDSLTGESGNDNLEGGDGNDVLRGNEGMDFLVGGDGDDTLNGGADNDLLIGGAGDGDFLTGGTGDDIFVYNIGDGADTIDDFNDGDDIIDLSGFGQRMREVGTMTIDLVDSFEDLLMISEQSGNHVDIDFGEGNTLRLRNTNLEDLDADDFTFAFDMVEAF